MPENRFPIKLDDCTLCAVFDDCTVASEILEDASYKLVQVKEGKIKVSVCTKEYQLAKGQTMLLLPFEKVEFSQKPSSGISATVISFTVNGGSYSEGLGCIQPDTSDMAKRIFADESINATVKNICLELQASGRVLSMHLLSLLCSQLLVYLLRNVGTSFDESDTNDANLRVCGQVMSYIDNRIYSMKNLREVAAAIGYNYSYISTLFHKTVGVTLNTYFKTKRMNEAKKLLQDNKTSVSEVARIMNYSSVYAFSKAFKEHFGSSPGYYSGRFFNKEE